MEDSMRWKRRSLAVVAGVLALTMVAVACGDDSSGVSASGSGSSTGSEPSSGGNSSSGGTLTLYNAQHESLTQAWVDDFTAKTGITVNIRSGKDFELANLLVQEGSSSPADVFITENSPAMVVVQKAGLFAPIAPATLAQVPSQFASPDGSWLGMAARSTVLVYNKDKLASGSLPTSIMDLADPAWKGKVGIASAGADFQAIVSAVLSTKGEAATKDWLKGLKSNAKVYQGNGAVMKAVNSGEIDAGVIYHYYWFKDQAESGANSNNTSLLFFQNEDPGAFVSVSGAGVVKSSKHPAEAQKLVEYLTGKDGQKVLADSDALEYTIGSDVPANSKLKPFSELDPPNVDLSTLNGPKTIELMQDAGLL
jgi:iron(III) transport system substrate-binding protein